MTYPKTRDEWWQSLSEHWPNLLSILHRYIGMDDLESIDGKLTVEPRSVEIETMKLNKNPDLIRYLNAAWWNAPDKPWIHNIPGWGILCDLCSEEYLLHDEEYEE